MNPALKFSFEFVEFIPDELAEGKLYVSLAYSTAVHKCPCSCGNKVVTPFSPTDWKLIFDGVTISLYPSIGNWSFPCRSHYWIRNNTIVWAPSWSKKEIEELREYERNEKSKYYGTKDPKDENDEGDFWFKMKKWWL